MEIENLYVMNYKNESILEKFGFLNFSDSILNASEVDLDLHSFIETFVGEKRQNTLVVIVLSFVYITIFLTGLMGNTFTFIVILRNIYMRTVTNYYLASLALSDVLALIFGKF